MTRLCFTTLFPFPPQPIHPPIFFSVTRIQPNLFSFFPFLLLAFVPTRQLFSFWFSTWQYKRCAGLFFFLHLFVLPDAPPPLAEFRASKKPKRNIAGSRGHLFFPLLSHQSRLFFSVPPPPTNGNHPTNVLEFIFPFSIMKPLAPEVFPFFQFLLYSRTLYRRISSHPHFLPFLFFFAITRLFLSGSGVLV